MRQCGSSISDASGDCVAIIREVCMMGMGSVDMRELVKFQENLNRLVRQRGYRNSFCESCAKELAARLLTKVIKKDTCRKISSKYRQGWWYSSKRVDCR